MEFFVCLLFSTLGTQTIVGSEGDIERIYMKYSYVVFRRCRKLLHNEAEALDAQQEVFLALMERPEAFQGKSSLGTYLYSMATFVCLRRRRKRAIRDEKWEKQVAESITMQKREKGVDETLNAKRLIHAILRETDDVTSSIATYHYVDGFSQKEIAKLVGLSRVSVNKRIQKFIGFARDMLEEGIS